ncbi:malate synthase A [Bdellovibrio sp. HCB2-146]|uniref:malate synthase A n=1 Tax=Bdellovibrio sp. HCB2-146 TaxID=3394362 RepID=UPI0039BD0B0B
MSEEILRAEILTPDAAEFLIALHENFDNLRRHLLIKRRSRAAEFAYGSLPHFNADTESVRNSEWTVAPLPRDLLDRRVEITGPAEPKMIINALNSGAKVFMADFEDSLSPTWQNILTGQSALKKAVRRELTYTNEEGRVYRLNEKLATLVVRPRGLHLEEKHFQIRGQAISASLFDFGLYLFHNAHELLRRNTAPYFYLPKLENQEEALWWDDVFRFAQKRLALSVGTIRATVLIETIAAAFEMDEILYSLKDHVVGLNAGRWDYIFSLIKKFHTRPDFILPDRQSVTMNESMMGAYCRLLVQTCHKRGAHAIGGMSAFIPNRRDPELTKNAIAKVAADKKREASLGFDGTWVAHPDLIAVAEFEFDKALGSEPHQKNYKTSYHVREEELLRVPPYHGRITEEGIRSNIEVSLLYLDNWFSGMGAVGIHNLMEDVATAEISRSQLWQCLHHRVILADGRSFVPDLYHKILNEVVHKIIPMQLLHLDKAMTLLNNLVLASHFEEFLTLSAYPILISMESKGEEYVTQRRDAVATARL